jgi:glycosyltransferase involved in cell wall biosynthesis
MQTHETMGMRHQRLRVLPGLLPEGWEDGARNPPCATPDWLPTRPFIASAGRMVVEKGFQTVIPLMRHVPGIDLVIAGDGPLRNELQRMARGFPNVKFAGLRSNQDVRLMFQRARSVLVPSLFPETFGLVVAEALTLGTRVIARRVGSIPEVTVASPDAMLFDNETELLALLQKVAAEDAGPDISAGGGLLNPFPTWFEEGHFKEYLGLIDEIRKQR